MTLLIAEISNHHLGSIEKAKELILAAKNSGADAVKGQAFVPEDMLKWGTMPLSFYQQCALRYQEYKDLLRYGGDIGITVFFTILSHKLAYLAGYQKYKKIHAGLAEKCRRDQFWYYDKENVFISLKEPRTDIKEIKNARILYATPYLMDASEEQYEIMHKFYEREIGISHHGKKCDVLLELHKNYNLPHVEKHFYLGNEIKWEGQVYRDCMHSYTPKQFEELAARLKS